MTAEITPTDVRVGDRIIITTRHEGTVKKLGKGSAGVKFEDEGHTVAETWELVERAVPPVEVGSRWVDPLDGAEFVALKGGRFASVELGFAIGPDSQNDTASTRVIVARLVPAEPGP